MTAKIMGALAVMPLFCAVAFADPAPDSATPSPDAANPELPPVPQRVRTCLPHENVDFTMKQEYGEKLIGQGISSDGTLVEVFMAQSGSFTVIKTSPEGTSCVVDFGDGWRTLNQLESIGFAPEDL